MLFTDDYYNRQLLNYQNSLPDSGEGDEMCKCDACGEASENIILRYSIALDRVLWMCDECYAIGIQQHQEDLERLNKDK